MTLERATQHRVVAIPVASDANQVIRRAGTQNHPQS
jgi:hypothetical protein